MALRRNTSDQMSQVSNPRPQPHFLPPYESINQPDAVPLADLHGNASFTNLREGSNTAGNRKSAALSIAQAFEEEAFIKGWPDQPRHLRSRTVWSVFLNIAVALMTLAPVAFIVLAILGAKLDGKPTEGNGLGRNVKKITRLGPSIYPILFAAVAGKSLKTFARYYAERGMQLGVLELLLASQTVWGTFESQVLLRRFTAVGVHLFLLWCLSPLGGQASLRLLETSTASQTVGGSDILYMPTGAMSTNMTPGIFESGDAATGLGATNALYSSVLLSPETVKTSAQDTWGNIKVPRLESIKGIATSDDGWAIVPSLTSAGDYTSLVGVPISGLVEDVKNVRQDFQFEHGYLDLNCPSVQNVSKYDGQWEKHLGLAWSYNNGTTAFYNNLTEQTTSFFMDSNTPQTDTRIDGMYENASSTDTTYPARNILLASEYEVPITGPLNENGPYALAMWNCTVQLAYVEAKASCDGDGCSVTSIRPSVRYGQRNTNSTPFDINPIAQNFLKDLPYATGSIHEGDSSPTELYLRGANTPYSITSSSVTEILNVSTSEFETRFQTIINTYYQLSLAPYTYSGDLPATTDSVWQNDSAPISNGGNGGRPFFPFSATTTKTTTYEVYKCDYVWFAILLASSVTVLALGSVGTALSHLCHAPDMMGFVSSFTYNNPYVAIPPGGTSLGAMERARLLRDVKVKLGDSKVQEDVGHVVFATLSRSNTVGDLNPDKRYR